MTYSVSLGDLLHVPTSRRTPLSRDRILRAGIRLADRQGIDALSMRRLATALRVEAMSLYNHVVSKDDLLDGMVNRVVGEITLPALGGDWKATMRARAHSALAVMTAHPWAPMLIVSRINVGPNMLRYIEATLGALRESGLSWAETDRAWNTMDNYIFGYTLQQQNFPMSPDEYASAAASYLPMIPAASYPYMHELSARVADGSHDGTPDFAFGLEVILDGLDRLRGQP